MKAYAITDIGKKRSFNQDYAWMTTDEIGKLPNLFIVADGMGGHRGGGYASRLAVETILEQIRQSQAESPAEILVDAIRHANECIRQTAAEDEQLSGMGTTVVAATCADRQLQVANVGDSRLYIADDAGIRHQTLDIGLVEARHRIGLEPGEHLAEARTLAQDRDPAESRLEPFERHLLEQRAVAVQRPAPLLVVVAAVFGVVAHPPAAGEAVGADPQVIHESRLSPAPGAAPRDGAQRLFVRYNAFTQHEFIVCNRLDFQVVVKRRNFFNLLFTVAAHNRLNQFAGLAS